MNNNYWKPLPNSNLDYFDTRAAVEDIQAEKYDKLPYTSKVLAENLVRRCPPKIWQHRWKQIIERKGIWFSVVSARVVCHDILGQPHLWIWLVYEMRLPKKVVTLYKSMWFDSGSSFGGRD